MIGKDKFSLLLRDVRSFVGLHRVPFRPLTILVGENSSGKSTLLAALSAVTDQEGFPFQPSLNRAPFSLGGFDSVHATGAVHHGAAKQFSLGFEYVRDSPPQSSDRYSENASRSVFSTYENWHGQPRISEVSIETPAAARLAAGRRSSPRQADRPGRPARRRPVATEIGFLAAGVLTALRCPPRRWPERHNAGP